MPADAGATFRFRFAGGNLVLSIPTHRYRIQELSEEDTEWLVAEVYGLLPESWYSGGRRGDPFNSELWRLADEVIGSLPGCSCLDRWERVSIVFRAYQHLRNIGVVELRREPSFRYIRHPLPADPLLKPSPSPCVRAAAALVEHAQPVTETHVSVPQQMMQGLLSGALVR